MLQACQGSIGTVDNVLRHVFRFIAGKTYYFGVGGGMRQFQNLVEEDGVFDVEIVWKSRGGN